MTERRDHDIVLYDLACTKDFCFSPVVWRIRMMLNYKQILYTTIFVEFPDIEPTLKELGLVPSEAAAGKYTVPAIHHIPTNTYMMDSAPIAQFLESIYPRPKLLLSSELGNKIETEARRAVGPVFRASLMPREPGILSPHSQEYFRRTREAALGHPLEQLLADPKTEEQAWKNQDDKIRAVGELMLTHSADGPFVLGKEPTYADFTLAGSLQCARTVDKGTFQRIVKYPGYKEVYEACVPYMEKRN